jgi:riboflavin transporter FmnP
MASSVKSYAKAGFGLGLGALAAHVIFILIGMLFFIPGYMMMKNQDKKNKTASYYVGVGLMIIGVAIMGGLGFGTMLESFE